MLLKCYYLDALVDSLFSHSECNRTLTQKVTERTAENQYYSMQTMEKSHKFTVA